jgi:hypothetical protein
MPTPPPDRSRRSLSYGQRMFLLYGPADRWNDAFADDGEVCEAWKAHRAHILSHYQHGRRPMAWWRFEAPIPYPGYDKECAALFETGLLGEEEREQLVAQWFVHFTRAQDPRFTYCVGFAKPSDRVATGLRARPPGERIIDGRGFREISSRGGRASGAAGVGPSASSRRRPPTAA